MKNFSRLALFFALASVTNAKALDLDWTGQFRAEANLINNYAPELVDPTLYGNGGYDVMPAGSKNARFQTLFLRLRPNLIVNDNVSIKSEWWLGNPITGFYGVDYPGASRSDQRYSNTTFNGGSTITAQRFWAEFLTDIGTLQVGRIPLHWGLGVVHNSGDGPFDRYQSTGDSFRLVSKFGNFALIPAFVKYNFGNAAGGTCIGTTCAHPVGGSTMEDYMVGLRYENKDEDFEGGLNFIRRTAGAQSESNWINYNNGTAAVIPPGGMNMTIWDIYAKKKISKFDFGIEAPVVNGDLVGSKYKTFALATELKYRANDTWSFNMKAGKAPGQNNSLTPTTDKWEVFYFHPSYHLGLIMFNYQFGNFSGNNNPNNSNVTTVKSIYDNPIVNANYLLLAGALTADKWRFTGAFVTAGAERSATAGQRFFNYWTHSYSTTNAVRNQSTSLGSEIDLGAALNWDESTTFGLDTGLWFPGGFYKFSNAANGDFDLKTVFAVVGSVSVRF